MRRTSTTSAAAVSWSSARRPPGAVDERLDDGGVGREHAQFAADVGGVLRVLLDRAHGASIGAFVVLYQSGTLNTALQVYRRPTGIVAWGREMWARVTRQVPTRNRALGSSVGSWDPNPEFTPDQLYGVRDKVGLLERTRKTHPILARRSTAARSSSARSTTGSCRVATRPGGCGCRRVARALAACETHDLPSLIAAVYESLMTFGHSVVAVDNTVRSV